MVVGIDASNIHRGGGITHLIELLSNISIQQHKITKIIVWGSKKTLTQIENYSWIEKISPNILNQGSLLSILWQKFKLSEAANKAKCDIIFAPGGIVLSNFRPIVSMSQNMLPFESRELKRFGISKITFRLLILRLIQSKSFKVSNGVIFLTNYAQNKVLKVLGGIDSQTRIIPHGLNSRFSSKPKRQFDISNFGPNNNFKLIYVSTIDHYKHQWTVVEAVSRLREEGYPITLDLVGPYILTAKKRLIKSFNKFDKNKEWAHYRGVIPYHELHSEYKDADLGVFASSCENLPIILIEKMASGLPIACSNKGPMPEILGSAGVYFDPENSYEIYESIKTLLMSKELRIQKSTECFSRAQEYSWDSCSFETFSFLESVYQGYQGPK